MRRNESDDEQMKYQRYKRGQIVLVDFTPSMGSEMRGKHFAIILTKKDSPNSGVVTVVPLSSKHKNYYLDIGNIVQKQIYPQLINISNNLLVVLENIDATNTNEENINEINAVSKNVKEFMNVSNMYIKKDKRSYALVQNITTISKMRIKKPVNKYDPLKGLIADSLILDLIDNKIKELFLNEI